MLNKMVFYIAAAAWPTFALADTVVLTSGQSLDAEVVSRTDEYVEIRVKFGTMRVPVSKISRIDADTPAMLEARLEKAAAEEALASRMHAEGKVQYRGKWVTEAERAADQEQRDLALKKKQEDRAKAIALAAAKKIEEQKRLAESRRQPQLLQQQQQNNTRNTRSSKTTRNKTSSAYGNTRNATRNTSNSYGSSYKNNSYRSPISSGTKLGTRAGTIRR